MLPLSLKVVLGSLNMVYSCLQARLVSYTGLHRKRVNYRPLERSIDFMALVCLRPRSEVLEMCECGVSTHLQWMLIHG